MLPDSMLFKNAILYRLSKPLNIKGEDLLDLLQSRKFVPCSGIKPSSFGWVSPVSDEPDAPLLHEVGGCYLLCAKREEKVVPTSALNEAIAEKVAKLENAEDRKIRAKEKKNIRDNTLAELLPRALAKSKQVYGYLSPGDNLLVIGSGTSSEAEMFINCLRDSIGSFVVVPPQVKQKPQDAFTHWLLHRKLPDNFAFGDQCDLLDLEDTSTVSCRRQDLDTQEIRSHLEAGKICMKLGLRWHNDLMFAVDKELALKQIKRENFNEDQIEDEDPIMKLDTAFMQMTMEFRQLVPELFDAFGGEVSND